MSSESSFTNRDDYGNFDSNLEFLTNIKEFTKNLKILEIGSGKGRLLFTLIEMGYNVNGIEIRQEYIDRSFELFGELPITRMSGEDIKYEDSTFDCVISFDVFEHIADSDKHLQEVSRILKPGGLFLLQTPNKWLNSIFETFRWKSLTLWKEDHCSLHNYWQLKKRFTNNHFSLEFFKIPIVTDFFKRKIKHYLGNYGLILIKIINPDKLPLPLRTNFYLRAVKMDN